MELRQDLQEITAEARAVIATEQEDILKYGIDAVNLADTLVQDLQEVCLVEAQHGNDRASLFSDETEDLIKRVKPILERKFPDLTFWIANGLGYGLYVSWAEES